MPTFKYTLKDGKTERWGCKFSVKDAFGKSRQVKKEGFKLKKDAQAYEREYIEKHQNSCDMSFKSLYEIYIEDKKSRIKQSSVNTKQSIFELHILPYFADVKLSKINVFTIRSWQNELLKKGYSDTYLRHIDTELRIIFNYAVKTLKLKDSPLKYVEHIGSETSKNEMNILTIDEFERLVKNCKLKFDGKCMLNVLFWCGMRVGEMRALTWGDIDFVDNIINIDKTYSRIKRQDVITPPKTRRSIRKVACPRWLMDDLKGLKSNFYSPEEGERIFKKSIHAIRDVLNKSLKCMGYKHIRIHDLRHSHASMLINNGVNPVAISRRLGHENVQTTLNIYSHLYPNSDDVIITKLDELKETVLTD